MLLLRLKTYVWLIIIGEGVCFSDSGPLLALVRGVHHLAVTWAQHSHAELEVPLDAILGTGRVHQSHPLLVELVVLLAVHLGQVKVELRRCEGARRI